MMASYLEGKQTNYVTWTIFLTYFVKLNITFFSSNSTYLIVFHQKFYPFVVEKMFIFVIYYIYVTKKLCFLKLKLKCLNKYIHQYCLSLNIRMFIDCMGGNLFLYFIVAGLKMIIYAFAVYTHIFPSNY